MATLWRCDAELTVAPSLAGQVAVVFVNVLRRHNHAHSPLSIAISDDMLGKTFPFVRDLELASKLLRPPMAKSLIPALLATPHCSRRVHADAAIQRTKRVSMR